MYLKSKNLKCVDLSEGFIEIGHDAFGGGYIFREHHSPKVHAGGW